MMEIEKKLKNAERFELFTGYLSKLSLHPCKKLGCKEFKREPVHEKLELVFMEKLKTRYK